MMEIAPTSYLRERRFDRRRLGHRRAPARSVPWRLDEHGELHHPGTPLPRRCSDAPS